MKAKSKKVFSIIKHIILITICIIMIFPFYWMIATAFKDTYAVYELSLIHISEPTRPY